MRKFNILDVSLIRDLSKYDRFDEKRVEGILQIGYSKRQKYGMYRIPTVEHRDYVFDEGVYTMELEWVPTLQTRLFELKHVQGRRGLKFIEGNNLKNSKGCPLLSRDNLNLMRMVLIQQERYFIRVVNY